MDFGETNAKERGSLFLKYHPLRKSGYNHENCCGFVWRVCNYTQSYKKIRTLSSILESFFIFAVML